MIPTYPDETTRCLCRYFWVSFLPSSCYPSQLHLSLRPHLTRTTTVDVSSSPEHANQHQVPAYEQLNWANSVVGGLRALQLTGTCTNQSWSGFPPPLHPWATAPARMIEFRYLTAAHVDTYLQVPSPTNWNQLWIISRFYCWKFTCNDAGKKYRLHVTFTTYYTKHTNTSKGLQDLHVYNFRFREAILLTCSTYVAMQTRRDVLPTFWVTEEKSPVSG